MHVHFSVIFVANKPANDIVCSSSLLESIFTEAMFGILHFLHFSDDGAGDVINAYYSDRYTSDYTKEPYSPF